MLLPPNLAATLQLVGSVYDHLNSYREYLATTDPASVSSLEDNLNSSASSSYHHTHYLFGAIQSLAQHLVNSTVSPTSSFVWDSNWTLSAGNQTGQWPSSVSVSGLIEGLPLPQDEATLNSELGLGPVRDPLYTAIPMTILYLLILVTGLIGNFVTCMVIIKVQAMHTATNYYLFSLAISDLLLLVLGLPVEIYQIWRRYPYAFSEAFCMLRGFSSEASTNSSVLTIAAFTVERYVAICHPLKAHTLSKLSRAIKSIVFIWLFSCLCAAPIAYQFGIIYDYMHDEVKIPQSATCNIKRHLPYLGEHVFALQSSLVFVLPVTLIAVLYILIGIKLRQSSRKDVMPSPSIARAAAQSPKASAKAKKNSRMNKIGQRFTMRRLQSIPSYAGASMESIEIFANSKDNCGNVSTIHEDNEGQCLIPDDHQQASSTTTSKAYAADRVEFVNHHHHHPCAMSAGQNEFAQHRESHEQIVLPNKKKNNNNNNSLATSTFSASCAPSVKRIARLHRFTSTTSSVSSSGGNSSSTSNLAQRRAVIKMLTAVVFCFFLCWAPFFSQRLFAIYVKNPTSYETFVFNTLTYISGVTYYLSATINPILYSIMSIKFRQAFHDTFVRALCPSRWRYFDSASQRARSMSMVQANHNNNRQTMLQMANKTHFGHNLERDRQHNLSLSSDTNNNEHEAMGETTRSNGLRPNHIKFNCNSVAGGSRRVVSRFSEPMIITQIESDVSET